MLLLLLCKILLIVVGIFRDARMFNFVHDIIEQYRRAHIRGCGDETPPIFSESVQNFSRKEKVGPRQSLVSSSPILECFGQRSVHDNSWNFYKKCSTEYMFFMRLVHKITIVLRRPKF